MKILHTSDWHIGKKIEEKSLNETLNLFFEWLITTIDENNVDVLIVAGDIFDNPFPNNSSLSLYYKTLYNLSKTKLKHIIITGGNHDSVSTLNAPKELLNVMNISVIGGVSEDLEDLIIKIKNQKGEIELIVCAVPHLREKDIRISLSGYDYQQKNEQIGIGIENFYKDIAQKVKEYKEKRIPIVATGHLFVNDLSDMEDEERELYIGGMRELKKSQIPDFYDYFALGHIHKPYKIGKKENARYCGSPIKLDFSEINYKNQVVIVDFENIIPKIEIKYIPDFRKLLKLSGTYSEILNKIKTFTNEYSLKAWASVEIIEEKIDPTLQHKIEKLYDFTEHLEIIKLKYSFSQMQQNIENKFKENVSINEIKPKDLFEKILEDLMPENQEELKNTFAELINFYLNEE